MKEDKHLSVAAEEERLPGERSRRDFLKLGGIGVAGLASSAALGANRKASVEDIPVVLESAINETAKKPYEPKTVQEHITEMTKVLDAGAAIAHNHSKQFDEDPEKAAQFYAEVYRAVLRKHPHAIVYPTVNLDLKVLHEERRALPPGAACAHHRVLAEAGLTNMVMLDTGVAGISLLEEDGIANDKAFYVYQFWPEDVRFSRQICTDFRPPNPSWPLLPIKKRPAGMVTIFPIRSSALTASVLLVSLTVSAVSPTRGRSTRTSIGQNTAFHIATSFLSQTECQNAHTSHMPMEAHYRPSG